ncbi:MAG: Beta-galactosidase C-terminal domain [Pseudomonadota bacterium]|nr:Beta-galactosidase C-terminal domain [Pseudomonadota bacterium]
MPASLCQTTSSPVIEKKAVNLAGNTLHFVFNYSENEREVKIDNLKGTDLLTGSSVSGQSPVTLPPWGVVIIEEKR